MFPSNSWSASKRKGYPSSSLREDDFYTSHSDHRSNYNSSRSAASLIRGLSRSIYIRYLLCLLLGLFLGRTVFAPLQYHLPTVHPRHKKSLSSSSPNDAFNSTLGTAAIIALNSPSRPDRRDFLSLMAAVTDLRVTYMSTWTTKPAEKSLPNEHNPNLKDVEYACWRSHADAWRKVVEEGWATAMIIEDDADWDGGIHESMALAWQALISVTRDPLAATEAKS